VSAPTARGRTRTGGLTPTLARLKVRLLFNSARRSRGARVQLAVALLGSLVVGGSMAFVLAVLAGELDERDGRSLLVGLATVLFLAWVLIPLITFGSDETVDPARLVLFPLRGRDLVPGLTAAAFLGPAPLMAIVAVLGAVVGNLATGGWTVVPAGALLLVLSVVAARTLSTSLASLLRSRRGRDAAIIVGSVLGLAFQAVRFVRFDRIDPVLLDGIAGILRWLPPGMLGQSVIDARAGRPLVAVAELLPAAVLILVLRRVWAAALDRALTGGDVSTGGRPATATHSPLPLLFRRLPLPARPWAAVAAKELRYMGREPRHRIVLVNSMVIALGLTVWTVVSRGGDARAVLVATAASYIAVLNSGNQIGMDGGARWIEAVAPGSARATFVGKNVAVALVFLPLAVLTSIGAAALTGGWGYVPAAALLAAAGLAVGLGAANVVSVFAAVRVPETTNPFAGRSGGQGCATSAILLACFVAQNAVLAPVVGAAVLAALLAPAWLALVAPLALVYGGVIWWMGTAVATRRFTDRQPEILALIDPVRGA
jgi:ABC-2 type transport system permease protein